MFKVFAPQVLKRSALRPLGAELQFVAIAFTAWLGGAADWSFTPTLGDLVWLDHIWIWGHPQNAVDYYGQVFFQVRKVTKEPQSVADIRAGENVLPIYHRTAPTIWGLGFGVWSMDFGIGRWFTGPALRFAMYGEGVNTADVNMHAAFQYMKPEV